MIYSAEITLWGTRVGAITLEEGSKIAKFEYDSDFIKSGIQVSPIMMPLKPGVFSFPNLSYQSFHGLPGLLCDSLPDKFGNELISLYLSKQGRIPESFNAIERLCYTGKRGMGALEYKPAISDSKQTDAEALKIQDLTNLAEIVLNNRKNLSAVFDEADKKGLSKSLQKIITLGTSAGGARAKAVISWNPETNEVRSGQIENPEGFEYWLLKFSGLSNNKDKETEDKSDFGLIEYAYYLMATECGIRMNPCRLLDDGINKHFMTKRFDRFIDEKGKTQKLHMQSLAALAHFDFNQAASSSYEQAFTILNALNCSHSEKKEFFRRMLFNVMALNCDDHVKNISFLMNKSGKWQLSPAYDLAFAYNPAGKWTSSHQMTINGKRSNFETSDYAQCAEIAGLKTSEVHTIYAEVESGIRHWLNFAQEAGVQEKDAEGLERLLKRTRK